MRNLVTMIIETANFYLPFCNGRQSRRIKQESCKDDSASGERKLPGSCLTPPMRLSRKLFHWVVSNPPRICWGKTLPGKTTAYGSRLDPWTSVALFWKAEAEQQNSTQLLDVICCYGKGTEW